MGCENGLRKPDLRKPDLREIELDSIRGRAVDPEKVRQMAEALADLLDEAEDASDVDGLAAELRQAYEDREAARAERNEVEGKLGEELARARKEHEEALGAAAAEAADGRAELAREADVLREEVARLKENADRAATWWRLQARQEVEEELVAEHRARVAAESAAEVALNRLALVRAELREIAEGGAEHAHRRARVLHAGGLLEETGTMRRAGYVPTRSERRRARAGK